MIHFTVTFIINSDGTINVREKVGSDCRAERRAVRTAMRDTFKGVGRQEPTVHT
jgi:hypothetical protein